MTTGFSFYGQSGYQCPRCGKWFATGTSHTGCAVGFSTVGPPSKLDQTPALLRIAAALERIADKLS